MSDAICLKCQEPWELFYLAHEAMWDPPGNEAPADLKELHEKLLKDDEDAFNMSEDFSPQVFKDYGGERLQKAVLAGEGCPSCWHAPERVTADEDQKMESLRHNLFDSGWDGDPAELF